MSEEFLRILALGCLGVSTIGFLAGVFWAIPTAKRDQGSVDPGERGMVVFANYQVLVARLSTFCLLTFVLVSSLIVASRASVGAPLFLAPRLLFFAFGAVALSVMVVAGPVARKRANRGEVARMRNEEQARKDRARLQATADDTNERLKEMQEIATGVRQRLEQHDTDILQRLEDRAAGVRDRLEEHDTRTQSERDRVRDDLGAEQSKVRDALGEQQDKVHGGNLEQDTNERIREIQTRGRSDQPKEQTDRIEGREHRADIDAALLADTVLRRQERQDDREERAEERQADREERAEEGRDS